MKLDRFTWIVIAVVLLLVGGAIFTVARTGGEGIDPIEYLEENTPEAAVYNAFVAFQRGDRSRARAQYSQAVLATVEGERGYDPFSNRPSTQSGSRLRIVGAEEVPGDPDRALVTFVQDTYNRGGPFGAGDTWSWEGTVEVVREEGTWKIDTQQFFN